MRRKREKPNIAMADAFMAIFGFKRVGGVRTERLQGRTRRSNVQLYRGLRRGSEVAGIQQKHGGQK